MIQVVFRVFQGYLKGVSGNFQWCFRMFQGTFKEVSRKIEGCFNGVLSEFQGCLQEVEWVFETDNLVMLKSSLLHQQRLKLTMLGRLLKLPIFIVEKAAAQKNGVEFCRILRHRSLLSTNQPLLKSCY